VSAALNGWPDDDPGDDPPQRRGWVFGRRLGQRLRANDLCPHGALCYLAGMSNRTPEPPVWRLHEATVARRQPAGHLPLCLQDKGLAPALGANPRAVDAIEQHYIETQADLERVYWLRRQARARAQD
jgi:hypothetical protein